MAQKYEERLYSVEEYLALETKSLEKHEYYRGRVYQRSGGSPEHALIIGNTVIALGIALRSTECQVYSSDVLIRVRTKSHYTYADASVVCGRPEYEQHRNNRMLTNPSLIVEVLSPSTQNYDRGTKFQLYKMLTSFQDYLLIDNREMYLQHYRKLDANTWQEKTYNQPEQLVALENLGISLTLPDIYRQVEFEPEPELPA